VAKKSSAENANIVVNIFHIHEVLSVSKSHANEGPVTRDTKVD